MFGLDSYSISVFWPSLLGIVFMTGAMVWAGIKMVQLTKRKPKKK